MQDTLCPTPNLIRAAAVGQIRSERQVTLIVNHLSQCQRCQMCEQIASKDPFVRFVAKLCGSKACDRVERLYEAGE